jgi:electron transfer flavoprotein alpha subunit
MSAAGQDVWIHVEHLRGTVAGHTYELLGKGRDLAAAVNGRLVAFLMGEGVGSLAGTLGVADVVICVDDASLAEFTPQAHAAVLRALAQERTPRLMLFGATSMGMDLAALLAGSLRAPMAVNCTDLAIQDGRLIVTSQMCGGKLLCEAEVQGQPAVATVLSGAFPAERGRSDQTPTVETVPLPISPDTMRMKVTRLIESASGDVDISKAPVLVAIGRGIQRSENLPMAEELAQALGGAVCGSRPVVDQGWLPISRQVGKSGMIVKPRLYLALGISGAPEHTEGMKDSDLIIAVNSDEKAPIFDIADYGVAMDIFELLPPLTQEVQKHRGLAAAS